MFNAGFVDSLKVRIRLSKVKILDKTIVQQYKRYYPITDIYAVDTHNPEPFTKIINGITYRFFVKSYIDNNRVTDEYLVLQLSAKMVKTDYFNGITLKNLPALLDDLNAFNVFYINYETLLQGLISDIDICINQLIDMQSYRTALGLIKNFPKESKAPLICIHDRKNGNLGVEFNKREKATPTAPYCKIYHKGNELLTKSYSFYNSYLSPMKTSVIENLVRYEFTIKTSKHKQYLQKQGYDVELKTFNDLLVLTPHELKEIAKSGLNHYLDSGKTEIKKGESTKPAEIKEKYFINELIRLGASERTILGYKDMIADPSSKTRATQKTKKIIKELKEENIHISSKFTNNNEVNNFLNTFGFDF